jgi:hypothetical protein
MQRVRSGRVAHFVAVVLLLWAGADLVNVDLCAIDRPPLTSSAGHDAVATIAPGSSANPIGSPLTGDDCFCCSHNALCATAVASGPQVVVLDHVPHPPTFRPNVVRTRLDRPPQLA